LSRVINLDGVGKERNKLVRTVATANRQLIRQTDVDLQTRDLASFVALGLEAIARTIDPTVEAWEKRGYWLKADRFRMDWAWAETQGKKMRTAVLGEDWASVAACAAAVAEKLMKVDEVKRLGESKPWSGAWERLTESP